MALPPDTEKILTQAVSGASQGGVLAGAGAIVSGAAMVSTPVRILWLVTVGVSTSISWPIVLGGTIGGALSGALAGALAERCRQERVNQEFAKILDGEEAEPDGR